MKKDEMIGHWQGLTETPVRPCPVPYKHEGSTYAEDGIRITGSKTWIDSILYRLRDLLKCENGTTRLQVVYKQSVDRETQQPLDGWNCYVQVHERGGEAKMMNAIIESAKHRQEQRQLELAQSGLN